MANLLQTERLIFRDWTLADVDAFHLICADERVMRFVGAGQPWSRDATERFISDAIKMLAAHDYCQWALVHKVDARLIGYCGFVPAAEGIEIGWRLATQYWGQGLASEAARIGLTYGFETLGCERIIATIQTANRASIRLAKKLGMTPESHFVRDGRSVIVYSAHSRR